MANQEYSELLKSLSPLKYGSIVAVGMSIGEYNKRWKWLLWVYRCALLVLLAVLLIHELPSMEYWIWNMHGMNSLLALIECAVRWSSLIINTLLNWKNNQRLNKTLFELSKLGFGFSSFYHRRMYFYQIVQIISTGTLCASYQGIGTYLIWANGNYFWYTGLIYIYTELVIIFTNIQFVSFVYLIKKYSQVLNELFQEMLNRKSLTINSGSHFKIFYDDRTDAQNVVRLRICHLNLYEIAKEINACYSVQILMLVALFIVEVTYSLRSLAVYLAFKTFDEMYDFSQGSAIPLTALWFTNYTLSLMQIIVGCELATSEGERLSQTAHKLINLGVGENVGREVFIFCQQLSSHTITFSAGGLATLRSSLIPSMLGAIITYLVVVTTYSRE